jgi:homoserine O-acetyltransferase
MKRLLTALCAAAVLLAGPVAAQTFTPAEGDFTAADVAVAGQTLPELKIHYRTLGQPRRGADGKVSNAVLLLHGTGGTGAQFLSPQFAGELFGPGQPLDVTRYYIIMPDNLGHGASGQRLVGLRPIGRSGSHHRAGDLDQLGRRLHQPAGTGSVRAVRAAPEQRRLPPDPQQP